MNAYEFNKIAGAVLSALLVIIGTKVFLDLAGLSPGHGGATAGYTLPAPEAEPAPAGTGATAGGTAPAAKPASGLTKVAALLAKADAGAGKSVFRKCKACHTSKKGGANRVGPNLWNVIGRKKAAAAGFKYSDAMKSAGGTWTFDDMAKFIRKPKSFVPGSKMAFAGISGDADLAALIVYLRALSDSPQPLPK